VDRISSKFKMQSAKLQFKIQNYFKLLVVVFSFALLAFSLMLVKPALGAILYLEPSRGTYQPGDTFGAEIRIDAEGECINVAEVNLSFSLRAVDFSQGNSIITLWIKQPAINQESGLVSFSGGIPNGYCGQAIGDPKKSNLLGKVIFKVPEMAAGESKKFAEAKFLNTSKVFLNDGQGSLAQLTAKSAIFTILTEKVEILKDEWQKETEKDSIPPEEFLPLISKDPTVFKGKYFITFSTTDKQTGIDHYEIREGNRDWKIVVSPYILENQKLTDDIWVKAVDKAGNERVEFVRAFRRPIWKYILYSVSILILIIVIIRLIWWIIKNAKRKKKNAK